MIAAYIDELGPAESIRIGPLQEPVPGPTDVLVAVTAVAVNPVDTFIRSGRYRTPIAFPFTIGRDLVGTVVQAPVGTGLTAGEQVWCNSLGHDGRQGSFAQFAVVPAARLYRLPSGVDPLVAVAIAHPAATAYLAWFCHGDLRPGHTVYVGGGAGNVGRAAITMAAYAGARVIAGARPADQAACRAVGADAVVDYSDPDLDIRLRDIAPSGVDLYWDTSGRGDLAHAVQSVRVGGQVLLSAGQVEPLPLSSWQLYTNDISLRGFVISRATITELADAAQLINRLLADGQLTARIADQLPLAQAAEAHRRLEAGEVSGRLVLQPPAVTGIGDQQTR
jgi:NADPH:quinone reductase-like Zn-dependent oxidoreductase